MNVTSPMNEIIVIRRSQVMSPCTKWITAVCMMSFLGCAGASEENNDQADIEKAVPNRQDIAVAPTSAAPAPVVGTGAMKPRVLPKKLVGAAQSPYLLDDEVIVKLKEGTHVRLRAGALRFDAGALVGN